MKFEILLVVITFVHLVLCKTIYKSFTAVVEKNKEECFFMESLMESFTLEVYFQVVDVINPGFGEMEISVRVMDPDFLELKYFERTHRDGYSEEIKKFGDYGICLDNSFDSFSGKHVFVDLSLVEPFDLNISYVSTVHLHIDLRDIEEEWIKMNTEEIQSSLVKIRSELSKLVHYQDTSRAAYSKDLNKVTNIRRRVDVWSGAYALVLLTCGLMQVFLVKKFFDSKLSLRKVFSW